MYLSGELYIGCFCICIGFADTQSPAQLHSRALIGMILLCMHWIWCVGLLQDGGNVGVYPPVEGQAQIALGFCMDTD